MKRRQANFQFQSKPVRAWSKSTGTEAVRHYFRVVYHLGDKRQRLNFNDLDAAKPKRRRRQRN